MPASARGLAVPPVERISTPRAVSARASSSRPLLSETERMARSMFRIAPDRSEEVRRVGDGVGVADGGDAERGRTIIERRRVAARVRGGDQRLERAELQLRFGAVEDDR